MAQVSNVQSRTLRVLGSLPESVKTTLSSKPNVVVLEKESNGKSKSFVTAEDISEIITLLNTNNVTFRPHFYSLFAKFNDELKSSESSKLNDKVYAIAADAEVSYSRVDENGHTGKVVVDRFEDYNTLRSHEGDITFYKFNRTKAQSRDGPNRQNVDGTVDNDGFKTVNRSYKNAPRVPREGGEQRTYAPRVPREGGEQRTYAPRVPREGGQQRTYAPRVPREGGQQRTYAPRQPREGAEPRKYVPRTAKSDAPSNSI
jgi:hypothetical protein